MAVGDMRGTIAVVAVNEFLDIRPSTNEEWVVHNIYHESDVQLEFFDGTNSLLFDSDIGLGVYAKYAFHVNNTLRIRVKNIAADAKKIGFDGIVTKQV